MLFVSFKKKIYLQLIFHDVLDLLELKLFLMNSMQEHVLNGGNIYID